MIKSATTSVPMAPATDELYREAATEVWCNDELEIDHDARVSASECGAWVHAWVWVANDKAGIENGSEVEKR